MYNQIFNSDKGYLGMETSLNSYKVVSLGLSDSGLLRQNNEDVFLKNKELGLYILADGMGGHQAGEVAAKETVAAVVRILTKKLADLNHQSLSDMLNLLRDVIIHVNKMIYKMGRLNEHLRGMGTTLSCVLFREEGMVIGHVGDSRIYRLRDSHLTQLTKDHSLLCELIDKGELNAQEAADFLYKNIITKAIGVEPRVDPSVEFKKIKLGDVYLLCSDGLSDPLSHDEIASVLNESPSFEIAAKMLINQANLRGGRDNITVLLLKIEENNA